MSLQDESFPTDELFEQLNSRGPRPKFSELYEPAAFERNPVTFSDSYTDAADKSANTCVSDPIGRHEAEDDDEEENGNDVYDRHKGRNSIAASCQDVHSAYTKRKYQHVTSKVAKYISDLNEQKKRCSGGSTTGTIQRHSSMPEYLTPKSRARSGGGHFSVDELHQMEETESPKASKDSSCVEYEMLRNEYETMRKENERIQSYSSYLQELLDAKQGQFVQLKRNFETLRTDLSDKNEKLKRHQRNSLRALNNCLPVGITKATQTDIAEVKTNVKANGLAMTRTSFDLSFNTSDGSIELALPTGDSSVSSLNPGNEHNLTVAAAVAPNNSESRQASSNDSAIDVENHGLRVGLYYIDKRHNRFTEIQGMSLDNHSQGKLLPIGHQQHQHQHQSVSDSQASALPHLLSQTQAHVRFRPRRISLGSRMLRIFGPCVSCSDQGLGQGQTINFSNTSDLPLLEEELIGQRVQR